MPREASRSGFAWSRRWSDRVERARLWRSVSSGEGMSTATRRVIFLDIDGVLAPIRQWDRYGDLEPACIRVLNEIVADGAADVVVSSTWRYGKTVAELQEILAAEGFAGTVVGKTPIGGPGADRGAGDRRLARGARRGRLCDHRRPRRHGRAAHPPGADAAGPRPAARRRGASHRDPDATAQRRTAMLIVASSTARREAPRVGLTAFTTRWRGDEHGRA